MNVLNHNNNVSQSARASARKTESKPTSSRTNEKSTIEIKKPLLKK
ncbi:MULTISPECIES: hypothetical protein [unclassified Flavobacterium]|nr:MULTISPECIES: hypothetical protein [unclassified Flavobacterium]TDP00237.1 hypothetical protein EV145_106126 [Flavobacterium sp. 245]TDW52156.1 hypothetical protein EV144_101840 [Flavobacterium sp. 270]